MAQKLMVQLVDDLDGTTSDDVATVQFGLDGANYEIDLDADNAARLRELCADYVTAGRRTGGRLRAGSRPVGNTRSGEAGQIRQWATENGYDLSNRGRIPSHITDAYQEAHQPKTPARTKTASVQKANTKRRAAKKA